MRLELTAAGAKAIAVDEATASESMGEQRANHRSPLIEARARLQTQQA